MINSVYRLSKVKPLLDRNLKMLLLIKFLESWAYLKSIKLLLWSLREHFLIPAWLYTFWCLIFTGTVRTAVLILKVDFIQLFFEIIMILIVAKILVNFITEQTNLSINLSVLEFLHARIVVSCWFILNAFLIVCSLLSNTKLIRRADLVHRL